MKKIGFWMTLSILVAVSAVTYYRFERNHDKRELEATTVLSFFGPPGSGKGTFAAMCVRELGFETLSVGDVCRWHIEKQTRLGNQIKSYVESGKLVPDELVTEIVTDWLKQHLGNGKTLVLDGFPRTSGQAALLAQAFRLDKQLGDVVFKLIHFDLKNDEIIKRVTNRLVCSNKNCQEVYSLLVKKPIQEGICNECGAPLVRRQDDDVSLIRARIDEYAKFKQDLLGFYVRTEASIATFKQEMGATPTENFVALKKIL